MMISSSEEKKSSAKIIGRHHRIYFKGKSAAWRQAA